MQLMPKQLIGNIGGAYLKNSKSVLFHPQQCEALESLTKVMSSGFVSLFLCLHYSSLFVVTKKGYRICNEFNEFGIIRQ